MPLYRQDFSLSPLQISILLALPVIVGSLGRIPLGVLTDRYGGKNMFAVVCLLAAVPVVGLAYVQQLQLLWLVALCLGIAGASFAVGVPYVNAWFGVRERGLALGVYAMGNAGTALSGLVTPPLALATSRATVFLAIATMLVVGGLAMWKWGRNAPKWAPNRMPVGTRLLQAVRWQPIRPLSLLYAVTFGAFVAFGLYLPVILTTSYDLSMVDAAARAAGFVLLATIARPFGGWLSDRLGALPILRLVFLVSAVVVLWIAFNPPLMPVGTALYLLLAVMLGMGSGSVFAYIGHGCPEKLTGTVSGIIGTAGGLGGFFPPLLMGVSMQFTGSYTLALFLLSAVCMAIAVGLQRMLAVNRGYK